MKKSQLRKIIREVIKEQDGTAGPRPLAPSKGRKPKPTGTSRRGDGGGIKKLTGKEVTPGPKKWYCADGGYDLQGCHQEGASIWTQGWTPPDPIGPYNTELECYVDGNCHDNGSLPNHIASQLGIGPDFD